MEKYSHSWPVYVIKKSLLNLKWSQTFAAEWRRWEHQWLACSKWVWQQNKMFESSALRSGSTFLICRSSRLEYLARRDLCWALATRRGHNPGQGYAWLVAFSQLWLTLESKVQVILWRSGNGCNLQRKIAAGFCKKWAMHFDTVKIFAEQP